MPNENFGRFPEAEHNIQEDVAATDSECVAKISPSSVFNPILGTI